jgi:hypothetical protein
LEALSGLLKNREKLSEMAAARVPLLIPRRRRESRDGRHRQTSSGRSSRRARKRRDSSCSSPTNRQEQGSHNRNRRTTTQRRSHTDLGVSRSRQNAAGTIRRRAAGNILETSLWTSAPRHHALRNQPLWRYFKHPWLSSGAYYIKHSTFSKKLRLPGAIWQANCLSCDTAPICKTRASALLNLSTY